MEPQAWTATAWSMPGLHHVGSQAGDSFSEHWSWKQLAFRLGPRASRWPVAQPRLVIEHLPCITAEGGASAVALCQPGSRLASAGVYEMDDATRLDAAQTAAADLLADWHRHGGPAAEVRVWLDDVGQVCIWVNGGGHTPSAWGAAPADLVVSVADYLHGELMDAARRVLPTCPAHGCGLHPSLSPSGPAWSCRAGAHVVGLLGSLPTGASSNKAEARRRRRGSRGGRQ